MSLHTWKAVFHPRIPFPVELSPINAIRHSLRSWQGRIVATGYDLSRSGRMFFGEANEMPFYADSEECALCVKYNDRCGSCPLIDCSSQFKFFINTGACNPMIGLLRAALKKEITLYWQPNPETHSGYASILRHHGSILMNSVVDDGDGDDIGRLGIGQLARLAANELDGSLGLNNTSTSSLATLAIEIAKIEFNLDGGATPVESSLAGIYQLLTEIFQTGEIK